jgi:nucleoside-diphosphate-sugar epimerase
MNKNHLFCFGFGYTASYIAKLLADDWKVSKTNKQNFGIDIPSDVTHMLISIPPIMSEDIVLRDYSKQLFKLKNLQWIGYISSSGVYGDHQGDIVDEQSSCTPSSMRNQVRLKIEHEWLALKLPLVIFRASGIYGPQRNILQRITSGQNVPIIDSTKIFSRIHVEDLASTIYNSMLTITPGEIFNLCDDFPCPNWQVTSHAYHMLNLAAPSPITLEQASLSDMALEFYQDSKSLCNKKIKQYFNIKLQYPTFKEGLDALFKLDLLAK